MLQLVDNQLSQFASALNDENEYKLNILTYISGFLYKKLLKKEQCNHCVNTLSNSVFKSTSQFIEIRNKGGLKHPPTDLLNIVRVTNSVFQQEVANSREGFFHGNFMKITVNKTVRIVLETYPGLLSALDDHLGTWSSHRLEMIKKIAAMFLTIRIKHSCRKKNEKKTQVRKVLSKQILFRHQ